MFSKLLKNVDLRRGRVAAFFIALLLAISLSSSTAFANEEEALAHNAKGIEYFNAGDYQNAIKEYTIASQMDTTRAVYNYNIANAYFSLKNYDATIEYLEKGMKIEPNDSGLYALRGRAYQAKGNNEKALEDFNKAIDLKAEDARTYIWRGYFYQSQGNNEKALEDFNKAIDLDGNVAWFYIWRAQFYESQGKHEDAAEDYNTCGNLDYVSDKYEIAVERYTSAIQNFGNNPEYYANRGKAYLKLKNHNADATKDFLQAGNLFLNEKNYQEAEENFNEVLKLTNYQLKNENTALAYVGLATVYQAQNKKDDAKEYFQWAAKSYDALGQFDNAIEPIKSALNISEDSKLYAELAGYYKKAKKFNEAIDTFTQAIALAQAYIPNFQERAETYLELPKPNYAGAYDDFKEVLRLNDTQKELTAEQVEECTKKLKMCWDGMTWWQKITRWENSPIGALDFLSISLLIAMFVAYILTIISYKVDNSLTALKAIQEFGSILLILLVVVVINAIAKVIGSIRDIFIAAILVYELLFISEKAGALGIPVPEWLKNLLQNIIDSINRIRGGSNNRQ